MALAVGAHLVLGATKYWADAERARLAHLTDTTICSAQDAQRIIQEELQAAHLTICSMRRRYNALAPVSRLPAEILAQIFLFCATGSSSSQWLVVTHVCHRWRGVALECHSLWSNITVELGIDLAKEFLRRARAAPIDINAPDLPDNSKFMNLFLIIASQHLHHIRQFKVAGTDVSIEHIAARLHAPAPILESMTLNLIGLGAGAMENVSLGIDLFQGYAPRLRHLSLSRIIIPWSTLSAFTSITTLILGQMPETSENFSSGPRSEYEGFLRALAAMDTLEALSLDYAIPSPPSIDFHSASLPIASLPKLNELSISSDIICLVVTMRHLAIPDNTRCRLYVVLDKDSGYGCDRIIPWLTSKAKRIPPIRSMFLRKTRLAISLDIWDGCSQSDIQEPTGGVQIDNGPPTFSLILEQIVSATEALDVIRSIHSIFDLSGLRRLGIFHDMKWPLRDWVDIFRRSPGVTHMSLNGHCAVSLYMIALGARTEDIIAAGGSGSGSLFPLLTFIGLSYCDLELEPKPWGRRRLWEYFRDILEVRKQTAPVTALSLKCCRVEPDAVKGLRSVVNNVFWDGATGNGDSDFVDDEDLDDEDLDSEDNMEQD